MNAVGRRELAPVNGAVVAIEQRNVGAASARGASELLARFATVPRDALWLATTDADSQVPLHWITEQLRIARAGFDAVAGTVQVTDWKGSPPHRASAYGTFYESSGDEHPHVHGANLGVRAEPTSPPAASRPWASAKTWLSAMRSHPPVIVVTTSARLEGRAPGGFASFLDEFARAG